MADRTPDQQQLADLFLALGVRLPLRVGGPLGREIRDADGHTFFIVLPTGSQSDDRARALAIVSTVNAATGTPDHEAGPLPVLRPLTADVIRAAEQPFDPDYLVALAQSARAAAAE
ncbi:hypothetical protein MPPM_2601 [Methylorubrum populi]|uniref:Uncharacterized protein n=1 Tax=Methylorubrum populi TaxID=223967 RepID=A0A160PF23_9HYPH|nr:hypothetical protein [Methylorubrum populi]BAU91206.1 hypothetical protein MPPM_2601 [Methylorubrum populi]